MIFFKRIKYKNFLAVGNDPIEIFLDASPKTLIVGTNGAGKSTMISAISFALFGKDFRKINKPGLINSINGKHLEVEIEFDTKGHTYLIRRGIKPAIFEIYMDGTLINQTASSKDYQKYIEENVLNLNFNSFKQIVVLGSNNYVPFMRLPAAQRREIIEDLLDISVFSRMNAILKDRMQETRDSIRDIDASIKTEEEKIRLNEEFIAGLNKQKEEKKERTKAEIERLLSENERHTAKIDELISERDTLAEKNEKFGLVEGKILEIDRAKTMLNQNLKREKEAIQFFQSHDHCPTCKQTIDTEFKADELQKHKTCFDDYKAKYEAVEEKVSSLRQVMEKRNAVIKKLNSVTKGISDLQSSVHINSKLVSRLEKEMTESTADETQEIVTKNNLKKSRKMVASYAKSRAAMITARETENIASVLLKDSGLKTAIIQRYIPYMNDLINEYLSVMEFYVSFTLDENFNESIKSRYRDDFSYENFSEGEKQRVDLAILFAWRQIAKMKNSMACNLLIFDEIADSSLDDDGVKYIFEILKTLENTNVFVISHRENMIDNFDRVLRFSKKGNFSTVEEI